MTERLRSGSYANSANISAKMANDLSPRKTMIVLVIVVGCFAVLWPKVFYPMLVGSAQHHIKPSPIDKTTGCCDVISETDVHTIKLMSELCRTIIKLDEDSTETAPLTVREIVVQCRKAVLETCGIDISAVLQEQVRLGQTTKQILDEIRSLNGSLCLKYNFGVAPWRLGVPHRVTVKVSPSSSIRQERPLHLRSEMVHPAFRERGRAIPQSQTSTPSRPPPRIVEGRPGPIPGMRPTMGGAGHVVPAPKQSTGSMGLIMPIYTIGIVIFFTYTVMKIVFKKQPEALYPPIEPDPVFRREVFEANRGHLGSKHARDGPSNKLDLRRRLSPKEGSHSVHHSLSSAGDAELDQLHRRLRETEAAMERIVAQMAKVPLKLQDVVANGKLVNQEDQATVKVLGMEMTASCEGGKKWSRPDSPVLPTPHPPAPQPVEPPHEIYLEGALPPQSNHLLVADSATETQKNSSEEDPAIVLAGKMTLSVISLDSSENGTDESSNSGKKPEERSSSNVSEDFEKLEVDINLEDQIEDIIQEAQVVTLSQNLLDDLKKEINEIEYGDLNVEPVQADPESQLANIEQQIIEEISKEISKTENETGNLQDVANDEIQETQSVTISQNILDEINKEMNDIETESNILLSTESSQKNEENKDSDIIETHTVSENILKEIDKVMSETDNETNNLQVIESSPKSEENKESNIQETQTVSAIPNILNEITKEIDESDIGNLQRTESTRENLEENSIPQETQSSTIGENILEEIDKIVEISAENEQISNIQDVPHTESSVVSKQIVEDEVSTETVDHSLSSNEIITELIEKEEEDNSVKPVEDTAKETEETFKEKTEDKTEDASDEIVESITTQQSLKETEAKTDNVDISAEHAADIEEVTDDAIKKLNEAIADLSSELNPKRATVDPILKETLEESVPESKIDDAEDEAIEDDEEVEYEYEESDNEETDEEIVNVDRIGDADVEPVERVNGENHEQDKNGTSNATVAEHDISDDENYDNENDDDDEEIQEIIEYITDEEEEELEDQVEPTNNVNHVNDVTGVNE